MGITLNDAIGLKSLFGGGTKAKRRPNAGRIIRRKFGGKRMQGMLQRFRRHRRAFPSNKYGYQFHERNANTLARFGKSWREATPEQRQLRKAERYYGGGLYEGSGGYASKFLRGARTFANSGVGQALGHAALGYLGMGEYNDNALIAGSDRMEVTPGAGVGSETGSITLSARQMVRVINLPGSGAFTQELIDINPGVKGTFPWLADIARGYEEYKFTQLVFEYEPVISDNLQTTSGQTGTICLAVDYNSGTNSTAGFQSLTEMLAYHGSVSGKITDGARCGVELDGRKGRAGDGWRFTRSSPIAIINGEQQEDYDIGTLSIAFQNVPSPMFNAMSGYLWVYYTVTFSKPKINLQPNMWHADFYASTTLTVNNQMGSTTSYSLQKGVRNTLPLKIALLDNTGNCSRYPEEATAYNQLNSWCISDLNITSNTNLIPGVCKLIFPSWFSGDVEVELRIEGSSLGYGGNGNSPTVTGANGVAAPVVVGGEVYFMNSLFSTVNSATGDSPGWFAYGLDAATGSAGTYACRARLRVKTAVSGVNNFVLLRSVVTSGTINSTYVSVTSLFSENEIEQRTSGQSSAKQFVDERTGRVPYLSINYSA